MSKIKGLLGIGNALVDILIRINDDKLLSTFGFTKGGMILIDKEKANHIINETSQFKIQKSAGGSIANTVNGLANLGISTGFVGSVGKDEFGTFFSQDMKSNNIDTHLFFSNQETGKSLVLISDDSERTMATYLGSAAYLDKSSLSKDLFLKYDYFYLEGYLLPIRDFVNKVLKLAKLAGNQISIDLSSFGTVEGNRDYLNLIVSEYVDIVLANEDEAKAFTGKKNPEDALAEIAKQCKIAVVKCGYKGSLIQYDSYQYKIEPIPVNAIDATGAGDLYAAGFFYGLINGYPLEICGQLGAILGGKVVEVIGAKMNDQKWSEVKDLINGCIPV